MHPKNPGYQPGNHWVECEVCGFDYRQDVMRERWDGVIVCPQDYETRHPQDFVRAKEDDQAARGVVNPATTENYTTDLPASQYTVPGSSFNHD